MRAGSLDRRIDIRRSVSSASDSGDPVETWTDIVSNIPARVRTVRGDERFGDPQTEATDQVEFQVRWHTALSDLNPKDEVIYPSRTADSPAAPLPNSHIYDVISVSEIGRREGFFVIAERRPDT